MSSQFSSRIATGYSVKPRGQVSTAPSTGWSSLADRMLIVAFAMLCATGSLAHAATGATPHTGAPARPVGAQSSAPATSGAGVYHDPQGRYSLTVPDGWSAEPQADSGSLALSSGPSWAMVVASSGEPSDINHKIAQQMQGQYTSFQVLNEGDLKVNGHPSHGTNATGLNAKGERVSLLVLSISAGGGHLLSVISSSPNTQAKAVNGTVMNMIQTVRFAGE